METKELLKALRKLKVETGSLACLGCHHEKNCGNHGCAILREAEQTLLTLAAENQALRNAANAYKEAARLGAWVSVSDRLPLPGMRVLVAFCNGRFIGEGHLNASGIWCRYMGATGPQVMEPVTHWMPLADAPRTESPEKSHEFPQDFAFFMRRFTEVV